MGRFHDGQLGAVLAGCMMQAGARRLQACCLAKRVKTREWFRRGLKMDYEGEMKGMAHNGENVVMYAAVMENHNGLYERK